MKKCNRYHIGKRVTLTQVKASNHYDGCGCEVSVGLSGVIVNIGGGNHNPLVQWDNGSKCYACLDTGDDISIRGVTERSVLEILNDKI